MLHRVIPFVSLIGLVVAGPAAAESVCDSGKLKCMRNKAGCLLKVHEKAIKKGEPPDSEKLARCRAKFDDPVKGCVAKREAKQNPQKPASLCTVVGDTVTLEGAVDACIEASLTSLGNPTGPSACDSGKLKCMRSKAGCLLKVHEKAIKKGEAVDAVRLALCQLKFDDPAKGCVAKQEAKQNEAKPATVCSTVGDTAALESIVDDCVSAAVDGATMCPAPEGLTAVGAQFLHQDTEGVEDSAEDGDEFGRSLAAGDFNGDGFDDLAVGIPFEDVGGVANAGAVGVFYGAASRLYGTDFDQLWSASTLLRSPDERFGVALATGDFDDDGYDDLAVAEAGVSAYDGSLWVIFGSPAGLIVTGASQFALEFFSGTLNGRSDWNALAAGDFDDDGFADIAYSGSALFQNPFPMGVGFTGWFLFKGSASGVSEWTTSDPFWVFDEPFALAVGQFNNFGLDELVAGFPLDGDVQIGGAVMLCRGGAQCSNPEFWSQDSPGIVGGSEAGDFFGASLATGDFDGDGNGDLAVGVPREDTGAGVNAGAFQRILGDGSGLTATGNQLYGAVQQQAGAQHGTAVAAGNFDGADAADEVATGAPFYDVAPNVGNGLVDVRFTSATTTIWHQNVPGVPDQNENSDQFGSSLTTGDFNGDGADDLAVGVPSESIGAANWAGAVNVFYGTPPPVCEP